MQIIETKAYHFNELSEEAKERAIAWYQVFNDGEFWSDCVIEDIKEVCNILGFNVKKVLYSVGGFQGDGACITGTYEYKKGSLENMKEYAPKDKELERITRGLVNVQGKNFYKLIANVSHVGRYQHSKCNNIVVERKDDKGFTIDADYMVISLLRDLMDWAYKLLDNAYMWEFSEGRTIEVLKESDYLFKENGEKV